MLVNVKDQINGKIIQLCAIRKYSSPSTNDYTEFSQYDMMNFAAYDPCTSKKLPNRTQSFVPFVLLKNDKINCTYSDLVEYHTNSAAIAILIALNGPHDVSIDSSMTSIFMPKSSASELQVSTNLRMNYWDRLNID